MFLPPNRDPNWFTDMTITPLIINGTVAIPEDLEELARSHGVHANILFDHARHFLYTLFLLRSCFLLS
jgi:hypothetical protein